jgi:hypothetical protein
MGVLSAAELSLLRGVTANARDEDDTPGRGRRIRTAGVCRSVIDLGALLDR